MSDFVNHTTRKAAKVHSCDFCQRGISKGTSYLEASGFHDGAPFRQKTHHPCTVAWSMAWPPGEPWTMGFPDDAWLREAFDEAIREGCITAESVAAYFPGPRLVALPL